MRRMDSRCVPNRNWVAGVTGGLAFALFAGSALADGPRFARDRLFDIQHIKLALDVDVEKKHVDAQAVVTLASLANNASIVFDASGFDVRKVSTAIGGSAAAESRFRSADGKLEVFLDRTVEAGTPLTVNVDYALHEPKDGLHFYAPGPDDPDAPYQVWSQGQAEDNHFWIPCFDHPNERQTTELIITCDQRFQAISNGRLLSKKPAASSGKTTYHWLQDQPHVIYLVTMVVGEFAVKEETWRGKPVQYFVPPERAADTDRSFADTPRMLEFFSQKIGVEYPWDKYAQICCYQFGGGMENTSATSLGDGTLHDEKAHADSSSEGLVAHELAHQWFGDLLTCREWAHLWLNEGFASYFEALWDEEDEGPDDFAHNMLEKSRAAISGGKELPIVHRGYENPGQQFDSRAYPKGAWVLHMLRRRLGDDTFWTAINHYVSSHRLGLVETSDLRQAVENITGRSWERFFYDWTERPGHPVLDVTLTWREADNQAEILVKQTQKEEAFHFPLTVELWSDRSDAAAGGPVDISSVTRDVTSKEMTIIVPMKSRPVMMRVDPGNTVLKEITEHKEPELWARQLRDDPDPVGRIFAAKALAKEKNDVNRQRLADALRGERFWAAQMEIGRELGNMGGDVARDALLAGTRLPDARARRACVAGLGKFKGDGAVLPPLEKMVRDGEITYRVEAAAINALADAFPEKALPVLTAAMDRDSPRETIRAAALEAMGDLTDPKVVPFLIEWSHVSKQRDARTAAINSLGKVIDKIEIDDATVEKAALALAENVEKPSRRVRATAARTLGSFGKRGSAALPTLQKLVNSDLPETLKDAIKGAIDKIQKDEPTQKKLAELKKRVEELENENKQLKEKLAAAQPAEPKKKAADATPQPKRETAAAEVGSAGGGVGAGSAHP